VSARDGLTKSNENLRPDSRLLVPKLLFGSSPFCCAKHFQRMAPEATAFLLLMRIFDEHGNHRVSWNVPQIFSSPLASTLRQVLPHSGPPSTTFALRNDRHFPMIHRIPSACEAFLKFVFGRARPTSPSIKIVWTWGNSDPFRNMARQTSNVPLPTSVPQFRTLRCRILFLLLDVHFRCGVRPFVSVLDLWFRRPDFG